MKKSVLITGASGLIGQELCREFIYHGFHVYGLDLKNSKIKSDAYTFIKCDLSKETQIKAAFKKVENLHLIINNAANTKHMSKKFENLTLKDWNEGIAVNLTSNFLTVKYGLTQLKKNKGSVINISSTRHLMSEPNTEVYSASKGGVTSLTHSLSISLAPHIRVNSISPGWIADPEEKLSDKDHSQHPAGRVGKPSDISKFALYLSGKQASFITGQDFIIDGGMTKKMIYTP